MKINYTSKFIGAAIKIDNDGNSGNNVILPKLNAEIVQDLIDDNDLKFKSASECDDMRIYTSNKFKETEVRIFWDYNNKPVKVEFHGRLFVNTYIALDIPKGYDFDIRNRSGNFKRNINVTMGLIDNPYTGEMGLQLSTYGPIFTEIEFETSISQIVVKKVYSRSFNFLHLTDFHLLKSVIKKAVKRGANGFGSTGKK